MTRRRYFVKQKLAGLVLMMLGIVGLIIMKDVTLLTLLIPVGAVLIFTKHRIWLTD